MCVGCMHNIPNQPHYTHSVVVVAVSEKQMHAPSALFACVLGYHASLAVAAPAAVVGVFAMVSDRPGTRYSCEKVSMMITMGASVACVGWFG